MANGLDIGSLVQAAELGRLLSPEGVSQRNLSNQLAQQLAQLNILKAQRDIQEFNNPQLANMRALQAQLAGKIADPLSGVVAIPSTLGVEDIIQTPGAITEAQQAALTAPSTGVDEAGFPIINPIPRAAAGIPITPIIGQTGPTGFGRDLNSQIQAITQKAQLDRLGKGDQFINVGGRLVRQTPEGAISVELGKAPPTAQHKLYVNPITNESDYYVPGDQPEGFQAYVRPASLTSGGREMTPNARVELARRLGKTETPIDQIDPAILSTPEAEAAYRAGIQERRMGLDIKPTGEESRAFRTTLDVGKSIDSTLDRISEFQTTGTFPGITQTAVNQFLSTRPDTVAGLSFIPGGQAVYSAFQRSVRSAQTPEARELEMRRALITSTILRAQAGLAQTGVELSNLVPYTPQISDSEESLIDKLNFLKTLNDQQVGTFREVYPAFRNIDSQQRTGSPAPATNTGRPATRIRSITRE